MGSEPIRPPIIPKLQNPPPRPNPELQPPMVIDFGIGEKQAPTFAVRFLISCLVVCLFLVAIAGFSILCTFQPVLGIGLLAVFLVLLTAYAMSTDEHYWGGD
jgi:purine-cytosine permease-like protein